MHSVEWNKAWTLAIKNSVLLKYKHKEPQGQMDNNFCPKLNQSYTPKKTKVKIQNLRSLLRTAGIGGCLNHSQCELHKTGLRFQADLDSRRCLDTHSSRRHHTFDWQHEGMLGSRWGGGGCFAAAGWTESSPASWNTSLCLDSWTFYATRRFWERTTLWNLSSWRDGDLRSVCRFVCCR